MESMESSTVAMLVGYFNIALITVAAIFAFFGVVAIFRALVYRRETSGGRAARRRSAKEKPKRDHTLLSAFCVAALAAFAVEAVFFNWQTYLKIFAGPELNTLNTSPDNPRVLLTSRSGYKAEIVSENDEKTNTPVVKVIFKNLNIKITSLFVDMKLANAETAYMTVHWVDETGAYDFQKKLLTRFPRDNYSSLGPRGNVGELTLVFAPPTTTDGDVNFVLTTIALNKRIPFYFSGLRLIVVSCLLFAVICFFKKEPRAKAAYCLFEYKFNPTNRKQNVVYALLVVVLILFSYVCINTSYSKSYLEYPTHQHYNKYLVDALAHGRTWLDYGTPENLLKAERPYDNAYRIANGYKFNSDVMWDWVWYKGKFYCYYGVVPAVILYVPYKLITGDYLSNNGGIFLFTAIIIALTAMLWRFCVKKYMPNAGFVFYILSFLTLFFASGISSQLRYNRFYSIVQTAGLMFALAGVFLLLKSVENEKINRLKLFFGCLCLALIAGCRPNMIFVSLLVPFVLWKYRSYKLLGFVALPYISVAALLCAYNYVRFESIFEFGQKYCLTSDDATKYTLLNPVGYAAKALWNSFFALFVPNKYTLYFPFVESQIPLVDSVYAGIFWGRNTGSGMINFPITLCLLYMLKKNMDKTRLGLVRLSLVLSVVSAVIIIVDSCLVGFSVRFTLDFAFFLLLPSLFCAYLWYADHGDDALPNKDRLSVVYVLLAVSVLVGLFLCVSGGFLKESGGAVAYDPVLYRYLECSLGIF